MKGSGLKAKSVFLGLVVFGFGLFITNSNTFALVKETKESGQKEQIFSFTNKIGDNDSSLEGPKAPEYAPGELIVKLKEGKILSDIQELNTKYNVSSTEKVFKDTPDPKVTLSQLKDKLAKVGAEHDKWFWQLDKDSKEYKDYTARIEKEKQGLQEQIQAQERLLTKLEQRQKRAPEGVTPPNLEHIYLLKTDKETNILQMAQDYQANPAVEYAEPNYIATIQIFPQTLPNDTYVDPDQNGSWSSGAWGQAYEDMWGLKKIQADKAWPISQGEGVVVAVVDTGIDYNHEDIAANVWTNPKEQIGDANGDGYPGIAGLDDDGDGKIDEDSRGRQPNEGGYTNDLKDDDDENGYVDDIRGWDFVDKNFSNPKQDNDPMDGSGHGTHVSGTIAAIGNNNIGVIGVAPKAKVMAVKGLDDTGHGWDADLANCLSYAADMGADVINNSWGGFGSSQVIEDAVNYAYAKGCVVVAAAGNDNGDVSYQTPAHLSNVIAVAATDENDRKAFFSNWGDKISVSAPGTMILSLGAQGTQMGTPIDEAGKYTLAQGTSMACPHVVGVAALVLSFHPEFTQEELKKTILASADTTTIFISLLGTGRINAYRALNEKIPPFFVSLKSYQIDDKRLGNNNKVLDPGETVDLTIELKNIWGDAKGISANLTSSDPYVTIIANSAVFGDMSEGTTKTAGSPFTLSVAENTPQNYQFALRLIITGDGAFQRTESFILMVIICQKGWPQGVDTGHYLWAQPVVADIDKKADNKKEIVVTSLQIDNYTSKLYVWNYDGKFLDGNNDGIADWPKDIGYTRWDTPALADIDKDERGDLEIIVPTMAGLFVFDQDGTVLWSKAGNFGSASIGGNGSPVVEDLDKDGYPEILTTGRRSIDGQYWLFIFNHDGTPYLPESGDGSFVKNYFDFGSGGHVDTNYVPAIGDIDGNGDLEILLATIGQDGNVDIYAWNHDGSSFIEGKGGILVDFIGKNSHAVNGVLSMELILADVDGMPGAEIICSGAEHIEQDPSTPDDDTSAERLFVFRHDGSLYWKKQFISTSTEMDSASTPAVGDVDGDGSIEIFIGASSTKQGKIYAWHSDGTELFDGDLDPLTDGVFAKLPSSLVDIVTAVSLGDIDGDGSTDVITTAGLMSPEKILVWNKNGVLLDEGTFDFLQGTFPLMPFFCPTLSDIDGDGDVELIHSSLAYKTVYIFDTKGKSNAIEWPMYQYNPQHTGCYVSQDTTPPTIPGKSYLSYGTNPNNTGTFSITWTASTDTESGLKGYQVFYNNIFNRGVVTTNAFTETNLAEGSYKYKVFAVDNAGNISVPSLESDPIIVDKTPPTIPGTPYLSNGTNPNNSGTFSITWTAATDNKTGIAGYNVYRNGVYAGYRSIIGSPEPATASWPETNLSQGSYTYKIEAVDKAGNKSALSAASVAIIVDKTKPIGSIKINNNATYTKSTFVTLTFSAVDTGGSGIDKMTLSNDKITWSPPTSYATTQPSWPIPSGDGTKAVYVKFSDKAGNWSFVYSDTIILDTTLPTITSILDSPDPFDPEASQYTKISYTLGDNLSSSFYIYVYIYNSAGTLVKTLGRYTQALGINSTTWNGKNSSSVFVPDGTYKYRIRTQDMAGNYLYSGYYYVTKK